MRTKAAGFSMIALCACLALGQTPVQPVQPGVERVFQFAHIQTVQEFQEICNLIRTTTAIKQASTDNTQKTLTVSGTADQIALAEWLYKALDQAAPPQNQDPLTYQAGSDDMVRLFYLTNIATVQEFQEIANATRTMTVIRTAFTVNPQRALAMRGSTDQIAMATWMIQNLTKPVPSSAALEYRAGTDDMVRMFYLTNQGTVQDFQEAANLIRTITNIRQAFTVNPQRAFAVRGTGDQIALAAWLAQELDKPAGSQAAQSSAAHEYRAGVNDMVRVFYLTRVGTVQEFQKTANNIRTAANIRQAFTQNSQKALALRGTADQMELCERIIKDLGL